MNGRGPNSRTPSPPQETPPGATASLGAGLVRSTKRRRDATSENDPPPTKRARLTRKNLALFDKVGKKESKTKGSKKAASAPPDSTADPSSPTPTPTTKTISTTTSGFAEQAYKNGILLPFHSAPPKNLKAIHERHAKSRATASPPASDFNGFVKETEGAMNEATIVVEIAGRLLKKYDDDNGYHKQFDQPFSALPKDLGFNNGLSAPQPDFVEGLERREYRPFPVDHIEGAVLYKDAPCSLALPHLAGELKGRGRDMEKARMQSAYDGAALVHSRNQALAYMGRSDPPGQAEVTTFTTDGTNLKFFAHYAAPSEEDGTLEYHQYQYASASIKDSYQGYKDGRRGLRNAQDRAREQSRTLRDDLKKHWKLRNSVGKETAPPVTTYTREEDGAGYGVVDPYPGEDDARPTELRSTDDEVSYEILHAPTHAPTPPRSSKRGDQKVHQLHKPSSSKHSSRVHSPPLDDFEDVTTKKRRTSSRKARATDERGYETGGRG